MYNNQQQQQQFSQTMQTGGSGLTRYRSAPSSYFDTLLNDPIIHAGFGHDDLEQLFNPRAPSHETQRIFSRFMNNNNSSDTIPQTRSQVNSQPRVHTHSLPPRKPKPEPEPQRQQQSNQYSSTHISDAASSAVDNEYNRLFGSFNSSNRGGNSGLIRHSSSPAGLFANLDVENEFGAMRSVGNFGAGNSTNAEASFSSANRFNNQMDYSSSSRIMDPISEQVENKCIGENNPGQEQFNQDIPGFPMNTWDESSILSDLSFLKGLEENNDKQFPNANSSEDQSNEGTKRPRTLLSHHLSLPKASDKLSAMERLLEDSVPCKIRAKRGFATHPRSIAERVRRTKISERMRKLQDLVPNMEKQTNTSDMLDLAVEYIKDLQSQVKTLSDKRAKCSCLARQQS